jgi:hypothetical protein
VLGGDRAATQKPERTTGFPAASLVLAWCAVLMTDNPFARLLTLEPVGSDANVSVQALWRTVLEAIDRSSAREILIRELAGLGHAGYPPESSLGNTAFRRAANEILTRAVRDGSLTIRLHDGSRAWRVPPEAIQAQYPDPELVSTWSEGRLYEYETPNRYLPLVQLKHPLLTTEPDSAALTTSLRKLIDQAEGLLAAARELSDRKDWRLEEVLYWIAFREPFLMAKYLARAQERLAQERGDFVEAQCAIAFHPDQSDWSDAERRPIDPYPASALTRALRDNRLRVTGLTGERSQREYVQPLYWVDGRPGGVPGFRVKQTEVVGLWPIIPLTPGPIEEIDWPELERQREAWARDYMARPWWNIGELLAWVTLRDPMKVAREAGPRGYWEGCLENVASSLRLNLIAAWVAETRLEPAERRPISAILTALQGGKLSATGYKPGESGRHPAIEPFFWLDHRLEDVGDLQFRRDEVMEVFQCASSPSGVSRGTEEHDHLDSREAVLAAWERAAQVEVYISQSQAEKIARGVLGKIDREWVRKLHKAMTGNDKSGPVPGAAKLRRELRQKKITRA